ncbi:MAG: PPC domain-containing protein [Polyangiaceae bacterium]|nr:PPC domain-containing protein [Polyangiaceae bacterium]
MLSSWARSGLTQGLRWVLRLRLMGAPRPLGALLLGLAVVLPVACGSSPDDANQPPSLAPLADAAGYVNQPISFGLVGSDPEGAALVFSFSTQSSGLTSHATLEAAGRDAAVFSWTPQVPDIGVHVVDFTVSDGSKSATRTVTIEVRSSGGGGSPVFRRPVGTGTTLDLAVTSCVELEVEVEDPDSQGVELTLGAPLVPGAELRQETGLTASLRFCPSKEALQAEDLFTLRFVADDGDNPAVTKSFVVLPKKPQKADCPGQAPVIQHTPRDHEGLSDVVIEADVSDDLGIKFEPLVLYSTEDPGSPPALSRMVQIGMTRVSGGARSGRYRAVVPSPVATLPSGSQRTLYYQLVARDDDDALGDCDHYTESPPGAVHSVQVTHVGGGGGLAACEPCSADVQCGGAGDLCVMIGGAPHCATACGGACPGGAACSSGEVLSQSGARARQCLPASGSCAAAPVCEDDAFEENDTRETAKPLPRGDTLLVSCPNGDTDDEDWFELAVSESGQIRVDMLGDDATDLDLALYDSAGRLLARSSGYTSEESIVTCQPAGRYYLRVTAYGLAKNDYLLDWSHAPMTCAGSCDDDDAEPDSSAATARPVDLDLGTYRSDTNAICPGDEDWFELSMFAGEELHSTLGFTQTSPAEDLDLLLYQGSTLLTRCTETDVSGCSSNGQSSTSNERLVWPIVSSGTYYLVVRGFAGASNLYDLCIGLNASDCP